MDQQALLYRAEIARKLKAARWIAGGLTPSSTGKSSHAVHALEPKDLAARPPLPDNRITASMIGSIERMERHTTPMELEQIARALRLPRDYFAPVRSDPVAAFEILAPELLAGAQELHRAQEEARRSEDATGHPQGEKADDDGEGRTRR